MKKSVIIASVAMALGVPGLYLACRAAGFCPLHGIGSPPSEGRDATTRGPAPRVPDPPDSQRWFHYPRADGAFHSYYESTLPPEKMTGAMKDLMLKQGWKIDELWTSAVGAEREGHTLIFRARGWQCDIFINKLHDGCDVTVSLQPVAHLKPESASGG